MEMQKVPEAGYKIIGLWISGIQRRLTLDNLSFPFKLISSYLKAKSVIKSFKPDVVVGVGGYASGPTLKAAINKNIPTLIQEQNSYAGLTNKMLAGDVQKICVAHEGMESFFPKDKIIVTGNPVRKDILNIDDKRAEALRHFDLSPDMKTILVIGGSLGARTLNESIMHSLPMIKDSEIQLIWQTGKFYIQDVLEQLHNVKKGNIHVYEFIKEMDLAYAAADVVISRAGALSISELCLVKKAVIFVPSPNVAEDHQTKNAMALVRNNAAVLVKDADAKGKMVSASLELLQDDERRLELQTNIGKLAKPDAANHIAEEVLQLITFRNENKNIKHES